MAYRVDLANLGLVGLGGFYYDFEYISYNLNVLLH